MSGETETYGRRPSPAEQGSLPSRIADHPKPALRWLAVALPLFLLEAGAVAQLFASILNTLAANYGSASLAATTADLQTAAEGIPTLLSRETIPNAGYYDGSGYVGTFLGMEPRNAWLVRLVLIYAYAFVWAGLLWVGYRGYRANYRVANWTPRDDVVDAFRSHYWGLFGLLVVFLFLVMVVFAPAMGTTTFERNIKDPYSNTMKYYDTDSGEVREVSVGTANRNSKSTGPDRNVAPMTYDDYGRFHPFGTLPRGKDLWTFIALGARVSLVIGLLSVLLSSVIAASLAMISAYYKGKVDLGTILLSDSVMALPQLLLLVLLTVVLADTWVAQIYDGAFVLSLIFAATSWPILWRALRGPSLQVSEREWIDAARSFGQTPRVIMRKHMFPYITGYLLIYGSMTLGGAIIAIAGLSFLGLGVNPPTPEWGRAIEAGQSYVNTRSWHISFIPGVLVTLVVTGFNALGDGIRDAIDPQSDSTGGEAAGRGGGA